MSRRMRRRHSVWLIAFICALPIATQMKSASAENLPQPRTVSFIENTTQGGTDTRTQTEDSPAHLLRFGHLWPLPTSLGVFVGWNTHANGSGTEYRDGQIYDFRSDLSLYAQWSAAFGVINFFPTTATGAAPEFVQVERGVARLQRVSSMGPAFKRKGFRFIGWSTQRNGTGRIFLNGGTYRFGGETSLYAKWAGLRLEGPNQNRAHQIFIAKIGNFAIGSSQLSALERSQIRNLIPYLVREKVSRLTVFGYSTVSDMSSPTEMLSNARAHAVAVYLRSQLLLGHRTGVSIESIGETQLMASKLNSFRCVEIFST